VLFVAAGVTAGSSGEAHVLTLSYVEVAIVAASAVAVVVATVATVAALGCRCSLPRPCPRRRCRRPAEPHDDVGLDLLPTNCEYRQLTTVMTAGMRQNGVVSAILIFSSLDSSIEQVANSLNKFSSIIIVSTLFFEALAFLIPGIHLDLADIGSLCPN